MTRTLKYRSKISLEAKYVFVSFGVSPVLLNSLFNPIIYTVRMRQFRVAIIELTCRTVNITEAEEIERRVFGSPSAVIRVETRQEHEGLDQQNVEEAIEMETTVTCRTAMYCHNTKIVL